MTIIKNKYAGFILVAFVLIMGLLFASQVSAATPPAGCPGGPAGPAVPGSCEEYEKQRSQPLVGDCNPRGEELSTSNCGILHYLVIFINFFSGVVGVLAVLVLIISGIQYSAARDNPSAVSAARQRILSTVIGLAFYIFFFAILQYLIPGGIF